MILLPVALERWCMSHRGPNHSVPVEGQFQFILKFQKDLKNNNHYSALKYWSVNPESFMWNSYHSYQISYIIMLSINKNSVMRFHAAYWFEMHAVSEFHELSCSFMSVDAIHFFVWAAHKNFAVLVLSSPGPSPGPCPIRPPSRIIVPQKREKKDLDQGLTLRAHGHPPT